MTSIPLPQTGGCQCGAVRYRLSAAPATLYACHCQDCQKQSGSAFALSMVVPRDALAIIAGTPREWLRPGAVTASGTPAACLFCEECGTRLYHLPARNKAIAVLKPGTLDDTSWLDPIGHIWTARAQRWVGFAADSVCFEGQPPDFAALQAAWRKRGPG